MSTDGFNPAQSINVPSAGVDHPLFRNLGPARGWTSPVLSDNETYSLGSPVEGVSEPAGLYIVYNVANPAQAALYAIATSSGAVSAVTLLSDFSPAAAFADDGTTNDRFHLYDSSGEVLLENTNTADATLAIRRL